MKRQLLRPIQYFQVQPPSGGCVLKPHWVCLLLYMQNQPPSGGCVLKRFWSKWAMAHKFQPPSGGCVLKPCLNSNNCIETEPAAFRRLCVETKRSLADCLYRRLQPPSGGCVLKPNSQRNDTYCGQPAAFRRLCVETVALMSLPAMAEPSRLQAAVC